MVSVERTRDVDLVDSIIEDPSIRDFAFDDRMLWDYVTCRPVISVPDNIVLLAQEDGKVGGCFLGVKRAHGTYEVHTYLLPQIRGKAGIEVGILATRWMRDNTEMTQLLGCVPQCLRGVKFFNRRLGFKVINTMKNGWLKDGVMWGLDTMVLKREEVK